MSSNIKDIAIKVEGLSKRYEIGKSHSESFRETLSGLFQKSSSKTEEFWALTDINFEIQKGDVVGIIGRNGAGKSTLLKILSRITKPTSGKITINGRIASLLEVGTGFHPELTGRENIFLNGTILGMTRKEVAAKFDEIVAFSGVEKFIDTPVKHYSSGMYVRLAFAVAAHLEPEILIVDEVLAVGDAEFQKKCLGKMKDVAGEGRTVIFVSHNLAVMKNLCHSGLLLKNGTLMSMGTIEEVLSKYSSRQEQSIRFIPHTNSTFQGIRSIELTDQKTTYEVSDSINIHFTFFEEILNKNYSIFITIKNQFGIHVFSAEHKLDFLHPQLSLELESNQLVRGNYSIDCFIHIPQIKQFERFDDCIEFSIEDLTSDFSIHDNYDYGSVFGKFNWKI